MKTFFFLLFVSVTTFAQQPSFGVKVSGKGQPMILIPGLYSSGGVWDETVAHYASRYECHAITLPGFAGQPPIVADTILQEVTHQLAAYIKQHHLKKPVIVGHSLGGYVALNLAVYYPGLAGDLVIVSSGAFLPALGISPTITEDSAKLIAIQIRNGMKNLTPAQVRGSQAYMLPTMMRDSAKMAQVTEMAVSSDVPTQAQVMYELYSIDLRPRVKEITSRMLVLGDWQGYKAYGGSRQVTQERMDLQFKPARNAKIVISDTAKHFIMFDEPAWFFAQVDDFLKK